MRLFDSHAHYEDALFDADRHERLEALKDTAVRHVLNCCSDVSVFDRIIDIVEKHDFVYGSIGIHPHWVLETPDNYLDLIRRYACHDKIVAIGEMGLDYYWQEPKDLQARIFEEQLQLARELDKPVIIHDRDAHEDCFDILRKYRPQGILHRYGGPVELLKEAFDWGMYVSFNNDLTYPAWRQPHIDCLMATPWDRLLIETDCPYAPPFERAEDRCESSDVVNVVRVIAELRNVSAEFVAEVSWRNALRVYRIVE
ncbi:MAG: TatD family hydrolase [Erysipelotrichaceae bacterium]|nr:TatD family hydrolase [Erysipelotrichaceae bacterium]